MDNFELLKDIIRISEEGLFNSLLKFLKTEYGEDRVIYKQNTYIYARGDDPVALVAHLDTVFKHPTYDIYYDQEKKVMWSTEAGVGDDRAGVYSIVKILNTKLYKPTIIFTCGEEIGGTGALELVNDIPVCADNIKFLIELDRQGKDDCVFYDCDNKEFTTFVENHGFKKQYGSFSDIYIFMEVWDVAGVNLSIGYENEHSYSEILHIDYMLETINKTMSLIDSARLLNKKFEFVKDKVYEEYMLRLQKMYEEEVKANG